MVAFRDKKAAQIFEGCARAPLLKGRHIPLKPISSLSDHPRYPVQYRRGCQRSEATPGYPRATRGFICESCLPISGCTHSES